MTQSPEKLPLGEEKGSPLAEEENTKASRENTPMSGGSDNDGAERPVREKLKKASIAGLSTHAKNIENEENLDNVSVGSSAGEGDKEPEDTLLTDATSPLRGRPTRKRSFDDLQNDSVSSNGAAAYENIEGTGTNHKRMRSRDTSSSQTALARSRVEKKQVEAFPEEADAFDVPESPGSVDVMVKASPGEEGSAVSGNQSPKKKRSRDQFDKDHTSEGGSLAQNENSTVPSEGRPVETEEAITKDTSAGDEGEPDKKRHQDASQEAREAVDTEHATKTVGKSSGFANTSAVSPFGALGLPKSSSVAKHAREAEHAGHGLPPTSTTAFAASGLSAFANSVNSPFGNLAGSSGSLTGSGFGSFGSKPSSGLGSSSGFGDGSPFAAKAASGFGRLGGNGFGSAFGPQLGVGLSKPHISSFAPPGGPCGVIGSGPLSKPLGKSEDDEEQDTENDDGTSAKVEDGTDVRDRRFFQQHVQTGEEAEETMFSCRAKLFHFAGEWKERGVGTLKLNVHYRAPNLEEAAEQKARLIMRTDGVHRVVLNTPIFKGMRFGTPDGKEPTGRTLNLTGMENGKPALFLLKIAKEDLVKDLYHKISSIHDGL